MSDQYCYSFDGEHYNGAADSVEGAIAEAFDDGHEINAGDSIFVGIAVPFPVEVDASDVLDRLGDAAYEQCGEYAAGWPSSHSPEAMQELSTALGQVVDAWLTKHNEQPHFFSIHSPIEYVVTVEEVAAHA